MKDCKISEYKKKELEKDYEGLRIDCGGLVDRGSAG